MTRARTRRRKRGTGSVDWHHGRWRARLPLPGRPVLGYFDDEDTAHEVLDAALLQLRGSHADPARRRELTVGDLARDLWLPERLETHRNGADDRNRWERYVASEAIARMLVTKVAPRHVRELYRALSRQLSTRTGERLSPSTLRNVRTVVRACFRFAVQHDLIETSPADGVDFENLVPQQDNWAYLELPDLERAEAWLITEGRVRQLAAFRLGVYAGLRPIEVMGLKVVDLRLDGDRPHVVVRRSRNKVTKTGRVRRVPLMPPAVAALSAWLAERQSPAPWLFPSRNGGCHAKGYDFGWADHPVGKGANQRVRPGVKTRAGITEHITYYAATRHTCASHLAMGSWVSKGWMKEALRLEEIRDWLGHSTVGVTERYAHLTADWLHSKMGEEPPARAPVIPIRVVRGSSGSARDVAQVLEPQRFRNDPRATYWIRTSDLRFTKPLLYRLS